MRGKRGLAWLLLASLLCLLLPSAALAANDDIAVTKINNMPYVDGITVIEADGAIMLTLELKNTSATPITITNIEREDAAVIGNLTYTPTSGLTLAPGATAQVVVVGTLKSSYDGGSYDCDLKISYDTSITVFSFTAVKTSAASDSGNTGNLGGNNNGGSTDTPTETNAPNLLVLSPTGVGGSTVEAPSGNAGESLQLRLPIYNRGIKSTERATDITVVPQISASLDSFPFVIEEVDYTRKVPDMKPGSTQEIVYNFKLSKNVTSGVKEVKFNAVYYNKYKQAFETSTFSVFVTVVKGANTDVITDPETITTTPKVIVESYTLTPVNPQEGEGDHLYAGEEFTLTMLVRNTSKEEAVKNIQLTLSNDTTSILPANNGSNSLYIDKISAGESEERTVQMQISPDAEAKSHILAVKFSYESAKTLKPYEVTENIALPVLQRIRVRVDDPVMYGEAMEGQSTALYFSLYNMGRSSLYNCMVDIEGEGMSMEETYYGGTVGGGNSMRADFNIIPAVVGEIEAIIVITFEDVYGQQTRIEKPMLINVQGGFDENGNGGEFGGEFPGVMEPMPVDPNQGGGFPNWAIYVIAGVVVIGLVVLLVGIRRKRRKRELEAL